MNKTWEKPELEVLDVKMTMTGFPDQKRDFLDTNQTEHLMGPS
ncbi:MULTISPECIES: paeninodin family lasso peptide [Paenibacillus]|uniref:Paeninodin family lasso peptide n=1 Tax=Paenibacillus plantarum TaxID=2654975 RepID=A0ABX1X9Z2_9BACL|nr:MULTISPECIES: paeninodin family lasso peptide [Paenibacillus]NOU65169.1 paeninodin family lasso peptide [Paenibacillus plantarum]